MESKVNQHCSKTEQQKRTRLDQRNVRDKARTSSESAEQKWSRLDKRNQRDRERRKLQAESENVKSRRNERDREKEEHRA